MPKVSKAQNYAIQYLSENGKDPEDISKELNVSLTQVKKISSTHTKSITDEDGNGSRVMDPTLSMQMDEQRKANNLKPSIGSQEHIFRPKK